MSRLDGKVAVITGGGGNIGRATALKLASEGASVALVDLNRKTAEAAALAVRKTGAEAIAFQMDVCKREEIRSMVKGVLKHFGHIDILVNIAGGSARKRGSLFHEADGDTLDWMVDVNLKGPLFCTRAVINHMIERHQGKIINIGSITGVQGLEHVVDYSAAKGGVIAFTKALAKEVGAFGVNVNCVSPGLVPRPDENPERAIKGSYLSKACTPEDVAELVGFLSTDSAAQITGQNYIIDGGRSLGMKGS